MSVLNKLVSYFPSVNASTQGVDTNLLTILNSAKHKDKILNMRASEGEARKALKEQLPCFTVAGTFNRRCLEGIVQLSGLAAVDLDSAEDYDKIYLLNALRQIPSIAYAGLSCSGTRLWAVVPFLYPDKYVKHYERLIQSFVDWGLPIGDECHKQISQPRFISYNDDSTQFFNHTAKPYPLLPPERTFYHFKPAVKTYISSNPENGFEWCIEQINKSHSFAAGQRHAYITSLARYCNIKGIDEQETLNGCLRFIESDFDETEIKNIVKHIYTKQTDSHNKLPYTDPADFVKSNPDNFKKKEEIEEPKLIHGSFLGTDGKFYIPNPVDKNRIAVYESPEAYNKRLHLPHYIDKAEADKLFLEALPVYLSTLTTVK